MAFSLTDFKKTTRKTEGRTVLYPHQLRDDRFVAAISYALDYYERMVGRPRHELQPETMMEFFGDPKLARGIVACLSRSYHWHQPQFVDVLGAEATMALADHGVETPGDLRARLYRYVNLHYHGFLPASSRAAGVDDFCAELPIGREAFERLLTLDQLSNAILAKLQGTPDARDIVNLYNYHSLETALRSAESLELRLKGAIWTIIRTIHNLARRYGLRYATDYGHAGLLSREATITLSGSRDALGSYRGSGRRIVRALMRLLAAHPDAPVAGEAVVHLRGRPMRLVLDKRALRTLGAHAPALMDESLVEAWGDPQSEGLQAAWARAFLRGETGGWRLRRDPEPLVTPSGIVVPDFALHRGPQRAALVLALTASAVEALIKPLQALAGRSLVIVSTRPELARQLAGTQALVVATTDTPTPRLLATALPSPTALAELHATKWQRLEQILTAEGFVDEGRVADVLEVTFERLEQTLRGWRPKEITYIPGIGLCTPETIGEIRTLLQPEQRKAA